MSTHAVPNWNQTLVRRHPSLPPSIDVHFSQQPTQTYITMMKSNFSLLLSLLSLYSTSTVHGFITGGASRRSSARLSSNLSDDMMAEVVTDLTNTIGTLNDEIARLEQQILATPPPTTPQEKQPQDGTWKSYYSNEYKQHKQSTVQMQRTQKHYDRKVTSLSRTLQSTKSQLSTKDEQLQTTLAQHAQEMQEMRAELDRTIATKSQELRRASQKVDALEAKYEQKVSKIQSLRAHELALTNSKWETKNQALEQALKQSKVILQKSKKELEHRNDCILILEQERKSIRMLSKSICNVLKERCHKRISSFRDALIDWIDAEDVEEPVPYLHLEKKPATRGQQQLQEQSVMA